MTDRELMQQALDALNNTTCMDVDESAWRQVNATMKALRARLAQPEPKQVIQARREGNLIVADLPDAPRGSGGIHKDAQPEPEPHYTWQYPKDYTAPPRKECASSSAHDRREWQGLTDEERSEIINFVWMPLNKLEADVSATIARAIEQTLKGKNQ